MGPMSKNDVDQSGTSGRGPSVLLVVVVVLFTAFVVQNTDDTKVNFLVFDFSLPLWALILASAVIGVLIRDLVRWSRRRRD